MGYGDFNANTDMEMCFAIMWMILGAGFYSYAIGNLASVLSNMDTRESTKESKI